MNAIEDIIQQIKRTTIIHDDCIKLFPNHTALCSRIDNILSNIENTIERELGIMMDLFGLSPFTTVVSLLLLPILHFPNSDSRPTDLLRLQYSLDLPND